MANVLIGLGANLGDAAATVRAALARLEKHPRFQSLRASSLHASQAIGGPPGQPPFVNAAARFTTDLPPGELLTLLHQMEAEFGRERVEFWGARTLDLDLLLFDEQVLSTNRLVLPHPRLAFRRFVLAPAAEVAGEMLHPPTGLTIAQLLARLNDGPKFVALASACWFAKQYVAESALHALHALGIDAKGTPARGFTVVGQPLATEIKSPLYDHYDDSLDYLARKIRGPLKANPSAWIISNYWPGEIKLGADLWFAGEARAAAHELYERCYHDIPTPKLLVHLEVPDDLLLFRLDVPGREDPYYEEARRQIQQRDALTKYIDAFRGVPVLRISAARPEAAIHEVVAAVESMQ